MAEQEMLDFSDLSNDINFKFKDKIYSVPAVSNKKAIELFEMSKTLDTLKVKKESFETADLTKEVEKEERQTPPEEFIKFQSKYISLALCYKDGDFLTPDEVLDMPTTVCSEIMKLISKQINGVKEEEEKKS